MIIPRTLICSIALVLVACTLCVVSAHAEALPEERVNRIKALVAEGNSPDQKTLSALDNDEQSGSSMGVRVGQGLLLCVGAFLIGVFIYRKVTGDKPVAKGRRMRVVERIPVSSKTNLILAQIDGREVLLAVGADKVAFITHKDSNEYEQEMELLWRGEQHSPSAASSS